MNRLSVGCVRVLNQVVVVGSTFGCGLFLSSVCWFRVFSVGLHSRPKCFFSVRLASPAVGCAHAESCTMFAPCRQREFNGTAPPTPFWYTHERGKITKNWHSHFCCPSVQASPAAPSQRWLPPRRRNINRNTHRQSGRIGRHRVVACIYLYRSVPNQVITRYLRQTHASRDQPGAQVGSRTHPGIVPGGRAAARGRSQDARPGRCRHRGRRRLGPRRVEKKVGSKPEGYCANAVHT